MKNELPETIETGGTLEGVQICPFGTFPNGKTEQVCDEAAFNKLVEDWQANGAKEIICDFEHRFEDPSITGDTSAAAWISNLAVNKERGLVGDFKFTDIGAEAVSSRRLRFLSPVWTLDADARPDHLRSVALTNKPNIPVACVLNREPQPVNVYVEETDKEPHMEQLKELLGLAAESSEEDILAAVMALKEQVELANKEKEDAEAESFACENEKICNKEALKAAYLANKEVAKSIVAGLVKPEPVAVVEVPPQKILNKDAGGTPPALKLNKADACAELAKLPPAERAAFYNSHAAEIDG